MASSLINLTGSTLIWVGKTGTTTSNQQIVQGVDKVGSTYNNLNNYNLYISGSYGYVVAMASGSAYTQTSLDTNFHIHTLLFDGSQTGNANRFKYSIDGIQQSLTFTTNVSSSTSPLIDDILLGTDASLNNDFLGYMGEVLLYTKALNALELQNTQNYLYNKWGISPPPSPSVTPSVTPSVSTTPSVTPSITRSPSVTPSITPSISITPSVTPSQGSGVTFSQAFTQSVAPTSAVETAWNTFRFALTGTYTQFVWSSTNGNSITVSDPTLVQTLANGLRTGTATSVTINSVNWRVGTGCGAPKIGGTAIEFSNIGSCSVSSTYALRPQINNSNWGGTNEYTVNAPSQTITLTFS
jgi:hypothetical protein